VVLVSCGSKGGTGGSGAATSSSSGSGGGGGSAPTCATVLCTGPGEVCVAGACVADCRPAGANPCDLGKVCNVSDASPGMCVDPSSSCVTTSTPEMCGGGDGGTLVCGPGSACDGKGNCYPLVPCNSVVCDTSGCYGTECACTRPAGCTVAPLGTPGAMGTLQDDTFRKGLVDLQFDPMCTAWGVTLISGPDYLRSIAPNGTVASVAGVTNLNMGEVAVLQHLIQTQSVGLPHVLDDPGLDVSLTYICCSACGCQLNSTPQGVAHYDPMTMQIPLVIPSTMYTNGTGPFGSTTFDTGPAGLSYGTDRVLYVGNIDVNGDYYSLDLSTSMQTMVTTFTKRVYASTAFDAVHQLVALEGGEMSLLRITDATSAMWATSSCPVTAVTRDFFDGTVYVACRDNSIWRYDSNGKGAVFQTATNPSRIAIAPDGYLYALEIPPPFADVTPTVERWQLPAMR
jgi:hypothetical protein